MPRGIGICLPIRGLVDGSRKRQPTTEYDGLMLSSRMDRELVENRWTVLFWHQAKTAGCDKDERSDVATCDVARR